MDDDSLQALAYQCELENQEYEELMEIQNFYSVIINGDLVDV